MTDLEQRAASARRAIDSTVLNVEPGNFQPPRDHRAVVVVVSVVGVALAAIGLLVRSSGTDQQLEVVVDPDRATTVVSSEPGPDVAEESSYYVLDPEPDGYEGLIVPRSLTQPDVPVITYDLYGRADPALLLSEIVFRDDGRERLFRDGDLVVVRLTGPRDLNPAAGETFTIGDTTVEWDETAGVLSWEGDDAVTGLLSTTFGRDQLLAIATEIIVDGSERPAGLDLLVADADSWSINAATRVDQVVYAMLDNESSEAIELIGVGAGVSEIGTSLLTSWLIASSPGEGVLDLSSWSKDEIDVDGQPATIIRMPFEARIEHTVDGDPVTISVQGVPGDQVDDERLIALARALRLATVPEVEAMIAAGDREVNRETSEPEPAPPHPMPQIEWSFPDGSHVAIYRNEGDQPCVRLETAAENETWMDQCAIALDGEGGPWEWSVDVDPGHAIALLSIEPGQLTSVAVTLADGSTVDANYDSEGSWLIHLVGTASASTLTAVDTLTGQPVEIPLPQGINDMGSERVTIGSVVNS